MPTSQQADTQSEINIRELLLGYLKKWYWFLISILLCTGGAVLYILIKTPSFDVTSTFSIRNTEEGGISVESNVLQMVGMGGNKQVADELEIYTSRSLMEQAIKDLDLQTEYRKKDKMRWVGQYPYQDVVVRYPQQFCDTLTHIVKMDLKRIKRGYKLSVDMQIGRKHLKSKHALLSLNDPIETCIGTIELHENTPLEKGDRIHIKTLPLPVLVDIYRTDMNVEQVKKGSNVVGVSYTTDMPQRSISLIRRLTELYNFDAIVDKKTMASNTKGFIEERMDAISLELDSVELAVERYKRENSITSLSEETKIYLESAGEYQKALVSTETQLNLTAYIRDFLTEEKNQHSLIPTNLGLADEGLVSLTNSYNNLVLRQMRLERSATESNPMVVQLDAQIAAMRKNLLASIETVRNTLTIKKNDLMRQQDQFNIRIQEIPEQERSYIALRRQQQIKQNIYIFLYQKCEENALTMETTIMPARVIDPPQATPYAVAPRKKIILLLALILGCCIPIGIIEIWNLLDNKIRGRKEYQKLVKAPFIGQLAFNKDKQPVAISENSNDMPAELFRMLRNNIRFMHHDKSKTGGEVILVTSSIDGEGKSFVAINTALSFALLGKRIALIGLDIRKPTLAHYLGLSQEGCLTSYLAEEKYHAEDTIFASGIHPNLDVLPAGIIPPNPNELLQSNRLDELIEYLRAHYDYIFLDSAPVAMVSDTFMLARVADMTLYVSRANYTTQDMTDFINSVYEEHRLPNMACVLNGVKSATAGYGYGVQ